MYHQMVHYVNFIIPKYAYKIFLISVSGMNRFATVLLPHTAIRGNSLYDRNILLQVLGNLRKSFTLG